MSKMKLATIVGLLLVVAAGTSWGLETYSIGDLVWVNPNANAIQENPVDEPGIPGALLQLEKSDDGGATWAPLRTTTTDADGWYHFYDLFFGVEYRVVVLSLPSPAYDSYVANYDLDGGSDEVARFKQIDATTGTFILEEYEYFDPARDDYFITLLGDTVDFGYQVAEEPGEPAIELIKTGADTAKRGDTITYHFKVTNTGTTPLDITVNDPMFGGVIWSKANVQPGEVNEFDIQYTIPITGDLTLGTHGPLLNEQMSTLCTTPPPPPPPCEEKFTNTATAIGIWGDETVTDESSWTVQVITYGTPAIKLVKTGPASAQRGDTITYHFKVTNTGTSGLDITVNDPMLGGDVWSKTGVPAGQVNEFDVTYTIPASGELASGTAGAASNLQTLCHSGSRHKKSYWRSRRGGGSCTPEPPTCEEKLTNTATATGVAPCKTVTSTSSWTVTVKTGGHPAIDLVKSGPATAKRGETITYHFKVTNTGDTALDISVEDPMFGGVIWAKDAVPAGQVNQFDITYTIPASGDLKSGTHGAVTNLQTLCTTPPPPCEEKLINTATATGETPCGDVTDESTWTVTITGTNCTAGYATYTQGGWGAKPSGNNPGKLLHNNWSNVFGWNSLVVGGYKTIKLTSAWAVTNFLPQGGTPGRLWSSYYNPTCRTDGGSFAGQVVALSLNVRFSQAGITKTGLGALKVQSGTYKYWTVDQVLALANEVLGGNTSRLLGSISDLNDTVTKINENFDNGANKGFLGQ